MKSTGWSLSSNWLIRYLGAEPFDGDNLVADHYDALAMFRLFRGRKPDAISVSFQFH
jgi:hypothetical protein